MRHLRLNRNVSAMLLATAAAPDPDNQSREIAMMRHGPNHPRAVRSRIIATAAACAVLVTGFGIPAANAASPATASPATASATTTGSLTNLAHLNWLLGTVPLLTNVPGHSTYDQSAEPTALAPWVYANHESDGSFEHVGGGGISDAAKGYYFQGAYDADDISRAAVVYVRDWQQNHDAASEQHAYQLLRSLTYLQTTTGPDAGNVVLWQQSDGTLNPSAIPVDLPNPTDSGESFWLARTVWALGEGYAAFKTTNPAFASFLQVRMDLAIASLDRQSLASYGTSVEANGVKVPAWLIVGSTSASAEAVLGLSAYVKSNPQDSVARTALLESANGIAAMSSGDINHWPFGAILSGATSQTFWNAWGGMAPAALSDAAVVLHRPDLEKAAVLDVSQFTAQLLATGGPDNGWSPTPSDTSQIAYGADSLVESLLTVADNTGAKGLDSLAAVAAGWYFGANPAETPVYDSATGVCSDGISATGQVNLNCGAESTIHTELSMLALDAHPQVKALATTLTSTTAVNGIKVVEAESGTLAGSATVATPASVWTGSANWSGGKYVQAGPGSTIAMSLPTQAGAQNIYPIVNRGIAAAGTTSWTVTGSASGKPFGSVLGVTENGGAGPQGIAPTPTVLHPLTLNSSAPAGSTQLTARVNGTAQVDAVLVQPVVSHLGLSGSVGSFDLYVSASTRLQVQPVTFSGPMAVSRYDSSGRLIGTSIQSSRSSSIAVAPGGFTTVGPSAAR